MSKKAETAVKQPDIWSRYTKCKNYITGKQLKERTERNWKMYIGKQWDSPKDSKGEKELPMFNFIKPTLRYKVSTIAQHSLTAIFSDISEDDGTVCDNLSKLFDISWERSKMDVVGWKGLKQAAVEGESYTYFYSGDTRKRPQLLHNTSVLLGDENTTDIQDQPYIIIEERLDVEKLKERAKAAGASQDEIDNISGDSASEDQLINDEEVSDKATSLIYMEKRKGIVNIARATKGCVYEKLHPIQQDRGGEYYGKGLTMYPIVSMIWEEYPNTARGIGEVEQMLNNQVEMNKTAARRSMSCKQTSFPRVAYDETALSNPEALDDVGGYLKLNGGNAQAISNMIAYLSPQSQSPDAKALSDELMTTTRELAGASDVAMGNYNPSRVAGTAITTIREQQTLPLNEQVAMYQEYVESVAELYFELWTVYNPETVEMGGVSVDTSALQEVVPNIRIDISENTTLSKAAEKQAIDNLFMQNKITFEEYVQLMPEHSDISKKKLLTILEQRKQKEQQQQQMQQQNGQQGIQNDVQDAQIDNNVDDLAGSDQEMQPQLNNTNESVDSNLIANG